MLACACDGTLLAWPRLSIRFLILHPRTSTHHGTEDHHPQHGTLRDAEIRRRRQGISGPLVSRQPVGRPPAFRSKRFVLAIVEFFLDLVEATRHEEQLLLGVSPRGALALTQAAQAAATLEGRNYVVPDDVKALFIPVCAHRVISKSYLQNGDANTTSRVLRRILDQVPTPR